MDVDYQAIVARANQMNLVDLSADDLYVVVRAHCICGNYDLARKLLKQNCEALKVHGYDEIILAQIRAFELQELDSSFLRLLRVHDLLSRAPYIQGEYYFTLGLLCQQQASYQQSITYYEMAKASYLDAGLVGQAAIAIFNLGLGAHHLRKDGAFEGALQELESLAGAHPESAIELAFVKLRAHRHIHQEEFARALPDLERSMTLSRALGRDRDYLSALSFLLYVLAKTDQTVRLHRYLMDNAEVAHLDSYYGERVREIEALSKIGLLSEAAARKKADEWCRKLKDPVTVILLLDLLLERCMRSSLFELSRRLSKKGARYSLENEQSISLVDWRHYEIQCLMALGQTHQARQLLAQYRKDAQELKSSVRLTRCTLLESQLRQADLEFEKSFQSHAGIEIELDLNEHRVHVMGMSISLSRKPIVEKFLKTLATLASGQMLTFDDVMRKVYGMDYDPSLHLSRINSLIDRTRELLGISDLICRRDGRIALKSGVTCRVLEKKAPAGKAELRRKKVFDFIRKSRQDVTIMQLETIFSQSRRTLQGDLSVLVQQGMIQRLGQKRSIRYKKVGDEA
jgi:tetratricopeptide (TPR) repeat protein